MDGYSAVVTIIVLLIFFSILSGSNERGRMTMALVVIYFSLGVIVGVLLLLALAALSF